MEEKQITIKNLKTNYKVFGQGQPMLILHGWPSSSEKWIGVSDLLSENGLCVIVPDLPGFGKSQEPQNSWSLDTYVDWLLEFCDKNEPLQKEFILVGHSFGGALACKFAIKYNQRVAKLFLISAACVRQRTTGKKLAYRLSKITKIFSFLPYYELFRKAIYKFVIKRSDYIYQSGVMKETYLRVILDDLSHKLLFINSPTVLIWGQKDESTPIEQAKFINSKIKNSKLITIQEQGHSMQITAPEVLSQRILENL